MAVVCALQPIPNQGAHTREDLFSMALSDRPVDAFTPLPPIAALRAEVIRTRPAIPPPGRGRLDARDALLKALAI